MLSKNTCEGVHLLVKLPAISLQVCKPANLLKMNFFTHIFQEFQLEFKLLFIVLFLEIISWKGASHFNGGGEVLFFRWEGFIFKCVVGAQQGFEKNCLMGEPPLPSNYGKSWYITCLLLALIYLNQIIYYHIAQVRNLFISTHFWPVYPFSTPSKHQGIKRLLVFSDSIK